MRTARRLLLVTRCLFRPVKDQAYLQRHPRHVAHKRTDKAEGALGMPGLKRSASMSPGSLMGSRSSPFHELCGGTGHSVHLGGRRQL